ncbi:hypothetical protein L1987_12148 [Smallanthus sonchifolius]|uniref:Uncharacterized protein n=1 Tax=Smallanthus sonchifolius TaxID=185202 RepID=A0ACB9JF98_9ASTR|nr:hypothetical protein L1987_12148 [Smallanthus sonchifolius]
MTLLFTVSSYTFSSGYKNSGLNLSFNHSLAIIPLSKPQTFCSSIPPRRALEHFLHFTLIGDEKHLMGCWNSDFVELFECLPLVEHLCMSCYPIKCFATGVMPQKLPTSLVHLKSLHLLGLSFARELDLLSALLLVTSSPNIETIILEMEANPREAMSQTTMNLVDQQDYSHVLLDHLRAIQIINLTNAKTGMDFVKLILAKSPMLRIVDIVMDKWLNIHDEVKMLKELLQYPRASARAEIRSERPPRGIDI